MAHINGYLMSLNIEIKARCGDIKKFKEKLLKLPVIFEGADKQTDTFFKTPKGRLKLRESTLYGNLLIPYLRPDQSAPKTSDYTLIKIDDLVKTKQLLGSILGVKKIVHKERYIYHYENVRIHIDQVKDLGGFIEFEAVVDNSQNIDQNKKKLEWLMKYFNISESDLLSEAYMDMLPEN